MRLLNCVIARPDTIKSSSTWLSHACGCSSSSTLRADGTWTPRPLKTTPWQWWFDKNDVSESSRALLSARLNMTFE
jgi:hypothetical protein